MSKCNITQYVSPNTCIGDSLATFNSNFAKLDEGLCIIPTPVAGIGTMVIKEQTEQETEIFRISSPTVLFGKTFDFQSNSIEKFDISLSDGTIMSTTAFYNITAEPYYSNSSIQNPFGVFTVALPSRSIPRFTLLWTASGAPDDTLFNTNSASRLSINGAVNTVVVSQADPSVIYIGGDFTTIGGQQSRKLGRISLTTGVTGVSLDRGYTGTLLSNPLTSVNSDLGSIGSVNAILESGDLLVVAGNFQSLTHGRGLVILNKVTGELFPFYVNGTVKCLETESSNDDINLYVGGSFDFINYNAQSVSVASGLRVYTNGLIKISLTKILQGFPNSSIDKVFASNQVKLYNGPAVINAVHSISQKVYIGGSFEIRTNSIITAKNLALISVASSQGIVGTQTQTWNPIVEGEVHKIASDGIFLYVAGAFNRFYSSAEFYARPRSLSEEYSVGNLMAFAILDPVLNNSLPSPVFFYTWKPNFNGPVTNILLKSPYVYCVGQFTKIGNKSVNGAAVLSQASAGSPAVSEYAWNLNPSHIPSSIAHTLSSIIIGGPFTHINSKERAGLSRVSEFMKSFVVSTTKPVIWQVAIKTLNSGTNLSLDSSTTYTSTSAYPGLYGTLNLTELTLDREAFKFSAPGDLVRFFVRRPKKNDLFASGAYVVGWKLEFV